MIKRKGFTQHHFGAKSAKSGAGFTLIELLVVIAIIGLLSSLAVVSLNSARQKARDARRVSDVRQLATLLELENTGGAAAIATCVLADALTSTCDNPLIFPNNELGRIFYVLSLTFHCQN